MIAAGLCSMKLAIGGALQLASCTCIGYGLASLSLSSGLLFLLVIVTLIVPPR